MWRARPICLRLFWHLTRLAASRTFCTEASSRPASTAMIAITTSNSIRENPDRRRRQLMDDLHRGRIELLVLFAGRWGRARRDPAGRQLARRFGALATAPHRGEQHHQEEPDSEETAHGNPSL